MFVEINTGALHMILPISKYGYSIKKKLGIASDPKCKDITRLCFASYHPELYKNISNQKFIVNVPTELQVPQQVATTVTPKNDSPAQKDFETAFGVSQSQPQAVEVNNTNELLEDCKRLTKQKKTFTEVNRNEFIYTFASNLIVKELQNIALQYAQANSIYQAKK